MNRLARKDRDGLFLALEDFANLKPTLDDLKTFQKKWPSFFPDALYRETENQLITRGLAEKEELQSRDLAKKEDFHSIARSGLLELYSFQDYLGRIWKGEDKRGFLLGILLGIANPDEYYTVVSPKAGDKVEVPFALPSYYGGESTRFLNWRTGEFEYEPVWDFQRVLYLLFKESWRAKTCARCSKYFIANKPAQMYCSSQCANVVKRARGLGWWRRDGDKWRKTWKEARKSRRKRGK